MLQENGHLLRSIVDKSEYVQTTSDYNSPITHYRLTEASISNFGLNNLQDQERALQEVVDDVCTLITRLISGQWTWRDDCSVSSDCCSGGLCLAARSADMRIIWAYEKGDWESCYCNSNSIGQSLVKEEIITRWELRVTWADIIMTYDRASCRADKIMISRGGCSGNRGLLKITRIMHLGSSIYM